MVSPTRVFTFVSRGSERIKIVSNRDNSFSTNDVDYCFILSHIILHLFLNVGVMLK